MVTHWDDDHIEGIHEVVRTCKKAVVACSLALNKADVAQFVVEQSQEGGALSSGLDDLAGVLRECRSTGRLIWAHATVPLYPRRAGGVPIVAALSPSEDAVSRGLEWLVENATGLPIGFRRRYRAPEGPNGASVAVTVQAGDTAILLGADLENSKNQLAGWSAVLAHARPSQNASLVKVPHHGSEGAHDDAMWGEIVEVNAIAIVTPWVLAGGHLPTQADLDRLSRVAGEVYLTAMPKRGRVRKGSEVDKLIKNVAGVRVEELRGWGHVRARRAPGEASWRVDLGGDARPITRREAGGPVV